VEGASTARSDEARAYEQTARHDIATLLAEVERLTRDADMHIAALDQLELLLFGDVGRRSRDEMEAQVERLTGERDEWERLARQLKNSEDIQLKNARAEVGRLSGLVAELEAKANEYRIEADCGLRDYDGLEVDAGTMVRALVSIAEPRPNKPFDPWTRDVAREALANVSEKVRALYFADAAGLREVGEER